MPIPKTIIKYCHYLKLINVGYNKDVIKKLYITLFEKVSGGKFYEFLKIELKLPKLNIKILVVKMP